jgi:hypothetical protein
LIWERTRTFQRLRSTLREYFPAALNAYADLTLTSTDALELLIKAPTPAAGAKLTRTQITAVLAHARRHNRDAKSTTIQTALREPQRGLPEPVTAAYAATATAHARLLIALNEQIAELEGQVKAHFLKHPDAEIYLSLPGIAHVTGARVLAQDGQARRQGTLETMSRLCEQDPTLAEATAHVVLTAMSQWEDEDSCAPALHEAARRLLDRLGAPLADKPAPLAGHRARRGVAGVRRSVRSCAGRNARARGAARRHPTR